MRRATLTTTELRIPAGHSHARRRFIAAVFGILALLTQAGFTLGASAALTAAPPGSLTADLAALCLGVVNGADDGWQDNHQPENAAACDHCTLCGVSAANALPSGSQDTAGLIASSARPMAGPRQAFRQNILQFRNPRAPPV